MGLGRGGGATRGVEGLRRGQVARGTLPRIGYVWLQQPAARFGEALVWQQGAWALMREVPGVRFGRGSSCLHDALGQLDSVARPRGGALRKRARAGVCGAWHRAIPAAAWSRAAATRP